MTLKAVIFDLDLTLISSSSVDALRRKRAWAEVYQLIPQLAPYEGVSALIAWLIQKGVATAIVTSSPGTYCERVIRQWNWPISTTVCYHDTAQKKPHAAPTLRALEKLNVSSDSAIAVGDTPGDIVSARAAGVFSVAATWGCADSAGLLLAKPDLVCTTVEELRKHIESRIKP
jgi:phosphoglycolate phosphatase-like HAD superfamily hydrolase